MTSTNGCSDLNNGYVDVVAESAYISVVLASMMMFTQEGDRAVARTLSETILSTYIVKLSHRYMILSSLEYEPEEHPVADCSRIAPPVMRCVMTCDAFTIIVAMPGSDIQLFANLLGNGILVQVYVHSLGHKIRLGYIKISSVDLVRVP